METTPSALSSYDFSMHGLREQIIANAATLYPQEVVKSASFQTFGILKPHEIFQVIVSGSQQMRATLLCRSPNVRIIASSPLAPTAEDALDGLLLVTCEALEWYTENLLGTMKNAEKCAGGSVDYGMVEGGFQFAAEQRILAERPIKMEGMK
ncbi:uncharacterized protein RCC_00043 [Ramularia collo-cygni]|uniref:Uncharacterized protein n=1 Tax=Ramularia collo-cygni TaxID=112498 RepID=A0A2D3UML7_9PEZI|nr:uncharacterized protein RCC_00043 [Ramularia collo-cygni]CZT14068.1 uncharacterized protein RCC_00043 [Ramularia collo-cygni]